MQDKERRKLQEKGKALEKEIVFLKEFISNASSSELQLIKKLKIWDWKNPTGRRNG